MLCDLDLPSWPAKWLTTHTAPLKELLSREHPPEDFSPEQWGACLVLETLNARSGAWDPLLQPHFQQQSPPSTTLASVSTLAYSGACFTQLIGLLAHCSLRDEHPQFSSVKGSLEHGIQLEDIDICRVAVVPWDEMVMASMALCVDELHLHLPEGWTQDIFNAIGAELPEANSPLDDLAHALVCVLGCETYTHIFFGY